MHTSPSDVPLGLPAIAMVPSLSSLPTARMNRYDWSNATQPPYSWQMLPSVGILNDVLISAAGF